VQDLALIKSRWPKEADAFLTMFGHVVIFPGIRHTATLEAVCTLVGNWDKPKQSTLESSRDHSDSVTPERMPILDPSHIS
jgi:hypothetical protein